MDGNTASTVDLQLRLERLNRRLRQIDERIRQIDLRLRELNHAHQMMERLVEEASPIRQVSIVPSGGSSPRRSSSLIEHHDSLELDLSSSDSSSTSPLRSSGPALLLPPSSSPSGSGRTSPELATERLLSSAQQAQQGSQGTIAVISEQMPEFDRTLRDARRNTGHSIQHNESTYLLIDLERGADIVDAPPQGAQQLSADQFLLMVDRLLNATNSMMSSSLVGWHAMQQGNAHRYVEYALTGSGGAVGLGNFIIAARDWQKIKRSRRKIAVRGLGVIKPLIDSLTALLNVLVDEKSVSKAYPYLSMIAASCVGSVQAYQGLQLLRQDHHGTIVYPGTRRAMLGTQIAANTLTGISALVLLTHELVGADDFYWDLIGEQIPTWVMLFAAGTNGLVLLMYIILMLQVTLGPRCGPAFERFWERVAPYFNCCCRDQGGAQLQFD